MAKYNSSPFGNISGEVLGVVASSNKGIKFLRGKGKTVDAKTEKQLARRAIYEEFCELWDGLDLRYFEDAPAKIKKDLFSFKSLLGGCLKLNKSMGSLFVVPEWKNATMSAPQVWEYTNVQALPNGAAFSTQLCFPSVTNATDFLYVGARIGRNPYEGTAGSYKIDLTNRYILSNRTVVSNQNQAFSDLAETEKMLSCKFVAYMNIKTGQLSKPLVLFINKNLDISAHYPFGK